MSETINTTSFDLFLKTIELETAPDVKVEKSISYMRDALGEGEKARFKDFWRMKKYCLEVFKENIHPVKRAVYWSDFSGLITEARDLQNIVEDQTNFQVEQIVLAIEALEKAMDQKESGVAAIANVKMGDLLHAEELNALRKEILFVDGFRGRVLELREALLKLEMRVSAKNKLLSRLSRLGDKVFPVRKKLLVEVSTLFMEDTRAFVEEFFNLETKALKKRESAFNLRNRIKGFQNDLKNIPVTNEGYRSIRKLLSESWDVLGCVESDRKQEREEQRKEESGQVQQFLSQINEWEIDQSIRDKEKALLEQVRKSGLSKDAFYKIRENLALKLKSYEETAASEAKALKDAKKKEETLRLETMNKLISELESANFTNRDEAQIQFNEALELFNKGSFDRRLSLKFDQLSLFVRDEILKVDATMPDSTEINEHILQKRIILRDDVKDEISRLREQATKVGLDFELAIELKEYVDENRKRLEQIEFDIESLMGKLELV